MADVHSNLPALQAVTGDARDLGGFDAIWLLGDVVGYGPQPNECIEFLSDYPLICVAGNHDAGVLGHVRLDRFNHDAAEACLWTRQCLAPSSTRFLSELPLRHGVEDFVLVHGSPRDPLWEYVTASPQARMLAPWCERRHALAGHTHRPLAAYMTTPPASHHPEVEVCGSVKLDERLLINPGSVGQPRDGDPRAAYGLLDTTAGFVSFHRVTYDVAAVSDSMRRAGLPIALARRLHVGY